MTSTPIWLLDFDGVVNAGSGKPNYEIHSEWKQTIVRTDGTDWPEKWLVCYAPRVIAAINRALDAGIEVRWLSTWQHRTVHLPKFVEHLPDLPTLTKADAAGRGADAAWWKLPIAQAAVGEDRPLLWTDDDLKFDIETYRWLQRRKTKSVTVAISPHMRIGLTQSHLDEISEFVALGTRS
jgi:hypothetical protein